MSFFKPTRNADFLRSRTLFFVAVLVLHFIWSIVAALDVSSQDTRRTLSRVVVASYNLGIQVLSFAIISFIVYIDSKDLDKSCWFSHTFFEIAVYSWISLLQLAGALAYSALSPTFECGTELGGASCSAAIRAILVGSWTISLLYIMFTLWFTTSVFVAAKRDSTVWRTRSNAYDWQAGQTERQSALMLPPSPIDLLNAEKKGTSSTDTKPRKTWVLPIRRQTPRPRLESTPHLPIQNLPPMTPFEPVPPIPAHLALPRQSIPEDISLSGTPDEGMRRISLAQSLTARQRMKIISIKPLRLHRTRASVDKSTIGLPRVVTLGARSSLTDSKYMNMTMTAAEASFPHWWNPESSFARRTPRDQIDFPTAPTVSSRYSTSTTIPPTPPPKDDWQLPDSAPPVPQLHFDSSYPSYEPAGLERRYPSPPRGYI
jgi:hypothetical protein